ncbi:MAG: GNAT family N-acetyltransferase [Alphaproteobacteria bacterium]|nr:GNAT family N-acetyltransferase [Alphaproteobacteria bacterium]
MIRPARPGDLEAILDLWEALQANGAEADPRYAPTPGARGVMRDYVAGSWFAREPFAHALVWEEDGRVVAFLSAHPRVALPVVDLPPSARIGDLYVADTHRRRGIGRALVEELVRVARHAGHPRVEVGTLVADARAVAFWRSVGFAEWQVTLARG